MFVLGLIVGLMIGVGAGFSAAALCQASKDADGDSSADEFEREAGLVTVKDTDALRRAVEAFERDGASRALIVEAAPAWDGTERRSAPRVSMQVPVAVRVLEQVQHNPYTKAR